MGGLKKIVGSTIVILLLGFSAVFAQPEPDTNAPGDPNEDPDAVPLGGVEILLVAGGALGIRKLIQGKDKK